MKTITHVAVKTGEKNWSLPKPNRHHNILREMYESGVSRDYANETEGFLDEDGNFLNRSEAYLLAVSTGQINRRTGDQYYQGKELYSEDLW